MKSFSSIMLATVFVVSMVGCGKTVMELRTDGEAVVDNGGSLLKKIIGAGVAVYEIVMKVVEDSKDNVNVIKDTVTGAPAKP